MSKPELPGPWVNALPFRSLPLPDWGSDYKPAMRATRGQAPSVSRASQLQCRDFGRPMDALAPSEQEAIFLALYNPSLFYLKEQCPLSPLPAPHPLQGHPLAQGRALPSVSGTVELSMNLGLFAFHRKKWVQDSEGAMAWKPLPWIGDLLLFLLDADGPYCVFWDLKAVRGNHDKPGPGDGLRPRGHKAERRARARYDVQRAYFEEAGIRIVELAREEIDRQLAKNLRTLFGWSARQVQMSSDATMYLTDMLATAIEREIPPIEAIHTARKSVDTPREECLRLLYQLIWRRQLKVDLFEPVLVNWPLCPERRDALDVYRYWFAR